MKTLIIALVFGIGVSGFAQVSTPQPGDSYREKTTPEQRQQKHLAHLTKELNLDTKQQEAVGKILAEKSAKAQDLKTQRESRKDSGEKLTAEEKSTLKNKLQAEKEDTEAKIKAVLSAEQYQKWLTIRDENKEKMKDRMRERRKL